MVRFLFRTRVHASAQPSEPTPSPHHIPHLKPAPARAHASTASPDRLPFVRMLTAHALLAPRRSMLDAILVLCNDFWLFGYLLFELRILVPSIFESLSFVWSVLRPCANSRLLCLVPEGAI